MPAPMAPKPTIPAFFMGLAAFPEEVPQDSLAHLVGLPHPGAPTDMMKSPALALRCFSWRTRGQREFCRIEGELDLEPHGVPQEDLVQRNARHLRLLPVDALCLEVLACAL